MSGYDSVIYNETGLQHWWPFGDTSGSTALDNAGAGGGDNGVYQATYTLGQAGLPGSAYSSTLFTSGWVLTTSSFTLSWPTSMEIWFKTTATNGALMEAGNAQSGSPGNWNPLMGLGSGVSGGVGGSGRPGLYNFPNGTLNAPGAYNDNNWHHAVATITSSTWALYLDAVLIGSSGGTGQTFGGAYWRFGDFNGGSRWVGYLAHAAVYGAALSQAQITNHYKYGVGLLDVFSVSDPQAFRTPGIH